MNSRVRHQRAVAVMLVTLASASCSQRAPTMPEVHAELNAALLIAVAEGRTGEVEALLSRGADVDTIAANTHDGDSVLITAVKNGYTRIVEALIRAGANPNLRQHGNWSDATPLIAAAAAGEPEIVRVLIESGANVNARSGIDGAGATALYWAVHHGHVGVTNLLLAAGAAVHRRDFFRAVSSGRVDQLDRLLQAGADARWRSQQGDAFDVARAASVANRDEIVALLELHLGMRRRE